MPVSLPFSPRRPWFRWRMGLSLLLLLAAGAVGCAAYDALGEKPDGERLDRIRQSPQYSADGFENRLPAKDDGPSVGTFWAFLFGGSDYREPDTGLPVVYRTAEDFAQAPDGLRVTWLGHSTLLVELDGARLLIDPVWGDHAAPAPIFGVSRFHRPPLPFDALPPLDAVLLSHDHYDHLDMPTVRALAERGEQFVVPLGLGAHLEHWGVDPEQITELDWWGEVTVGTRTVGAQTVGAQTVGRRGGAVRLVATPARHFSGRSLFDRDKTLWAGWALVGPEHRVFYSGDTALAPEFGEVGERFGPFDMTLIESGAYNEAWVDMHLGPEQAVAVHRLVRGDLMVPVHWSTFNLALHGWTEPVERVRAAAQAAGIRAAFPRPGESVTLDDAPTRQWWPDLPWQTAAEAPALSSSIPDSVAALIPQ